MVQFYIRKIKDGAITLQGVPPLWRKKVEDILSQKDIDEMRSNCN